MEKIKENSLLTTMESKFVYIFFVILVLNQIGHIYSEEVCPDFSLKHHEKPFEVEKEILLNKMMTDLTLHLTPKGLELKEAIIKMIKGEEQELKDTAITTTWWSWVFLPHWQKNPNLCPFVDVIDATVDKLKKGDCHNLVKALDGVVDRMIVATELAADKGLDLTGCGKGVKWFKYEKHTCLDDYVCKFDELWELEGLKYPVEVKKLVYDLYASLDKRDKMLALFFTASLSKPFIHIGKIFEIATKIHLHKLTTIEKFHLDCCYKYYDELKLLVRSVDEEGHKVSLNTKKEYGCH